MKNNQGFSLIELILYIAITSVILVIVSQFMGGILESRVKNRTIAEVEQQGVQIMETITQTIRNAQAITSPSQGNNYSALTLDVVNVVDDPTIFDLSAGVVRIKEGTAVAIGLNNSVVEVSNLTFDNLSKTGTPGLVRVEFTIDYINNSGRQEFDWSKTFYGSASLR